MQFRNLFPKYSQKVVSFSENVVGKERQDKGAYLTAFNSLCACGLEVSEFEGLGSGLRPESHILRIIAALQECGIVLGKAVGRFYKLCFGGVKESSDKHCVFHHYLVPEAFHFFH